MKASLFKMLPLAICVAGTGPAMAAVDLSAGATIGTSHDTNVYQLSGIEPPPLDENGADRSDTTRHLSAFGAVRFGSSGPLNLRLNANYSRVESEASEGLDRGDYSFGGALEWKPSQVFDVSFEALQNRLPLGLADVGGTEAAQQRARSATARLQIRPTPRWQVGLSPGWSETRTPLPDAEDFRLREKTAEVSLDFLGAGRLVPGIAAIGRWGRNAAIENATQYRERSLQGTLGYAATGLSTLALSAGYTRRTTSLIVPSTDPVAQDFEGTNSAFTGSLNFNRQLSVKTSLYASAFRYFEQYDAGVNPSVGSGLAVGATWSPTSKITVDVDTGLVWSSIEGATGIVGDKRRNDVVRSYTMSVDYSATRLLSVRAHVTRMIRRSEIWTDQFNSTVAGLELTASID